MKRSDLAQTILKIDGHPFSLKERKYLLPVYNQSALEIVLMAGRQVEKSTTLSANIVTESLVPHTKILYVAPTWNQVRVFSKAKLDEMYQDSALDGTIYKKSKSSGVAEKNLLNFSVVYLRSAYRDADSIRGISAKRVFVDEYQDILTDLVPVIDECASHFPDSRFYRAGTPKTLENGIQIKWEESTQCEWMVKCSCGKWLNFTDVRLVVPGKPGVYCPYCSKEINPLDGIWVKGQDSEVLGFRLPQIILPKQYINWHKLWNKIKTYPLAQLMNEVFGISWDNAEKPITLQELKECCDPNLKNELQYKLVGKHKFVAGIDWGTGENSFTVLTIGYFNPMGKFTTMFIKIYKGHEASNKDVMIKDIAQHIKAMGCTVVGADWGFGWGLNQDLRKMIKPTPVLEYYSSDGQADFAKYNAGRITISRTEAMTNVFMALKKKQIILPRWEDFMEFSEQVLNIFIDYRTKTRKMYYDHTPGKPDDFFHSLMYSYLTALYLVGKLPLTKEL